VEHALIRTSTSQGSTRDPSPASWHIFDLLVGIALVLTVVATYFREPLTTRSFVLDANGAGSLFRMFLYDDRGNEGTSQASVDPHAPLKWTCVLTQKYAYRYCGFALDLDPRATAHGIDLSGFRRIKVRLSYSGPGDSIRILMKNNNRAYLAAGAPDANKRSEASILVSQGWQDVGLSFDDLTVAEWWRGSGGSQSSILAHPEFDNVVSVEVVTGASAGPGVYRIQVESIVLEGAIISPEAWYVGMFGLWTLIVGAIMIQRRRERGKWKEQLTTSLQTTLNTIPHMVWSMDEAGRMHFNDRWDEFTGIPLGEQGYVGWLDLVHPDELQPVSEAWEECAAQGEPFEIECRLKHRSGEYRWVLARAVPSNVIKSGGGESWYGTCTDIHDRVAAQSALLESVASERQKSQQLKWASEHDALTCLPNRRAFQDCLEQVTAEARRARGEVGLLLIDLDHFKHVNDSLGHFAGDSLLKAVAERLRQSVRREDFVARLGGDEFAILLGEGGREDLQNVCEALLATLQTPLRIDDHVLRPGASIGAAVFPTDAVNGDDVFKAADAALYALKRSGRGGYRLFQSYMLEDVKRAALQLACAREIVAENSITAFYQPKVSVRDGSLVGFEALLRYRTPSGTLGMPDSIDEAFRDYELAAKIGELMQRKVALDIRGWLDRGFAFGRVSVNAAPAEFLRDDYAERLLRILARAGVPAEYIEVEVTEHALLDRGPEYVARALKVLKQAGVTVSLDDFGTGYSSLSHMRDFPVDVIKIDQSFVAQITTNAEVAALIAGVVHLASSLGLAVVAEGVETPEQLQLLRSTGCDFAQGHLFGAAAEATAVTIDVPMRSAAISAA
jgi:diguanylate cyclase (GGDEF)-like protein/PAS domain S-box-containing protein